MVRKKRIKMKLNIPKEVPFYHNLSRGLSKEVNDFKPKRVLKKISRMSSEENKELYKLRADLLFCYFEGLKPVCFPKCKGLGFRAVRFATELPIKSRVTLYRHIEDRVKKGILKKIKNDVGRKSRGRPKQRKNVLCNKERPSKYLYRLNIKQSKKCDEILKRTGIGKSMAVDLFRFQLKMVKQKHGEDYTEFLKEQSRIILDRLFYYVTGEKNQWNVIIENIIESIENTKEILLKIEEKDFEKIF